MATMEGDRLFGDAKKGGGLRAKQLQENPLCDGDATQVRIIMATTGHYCSPQLICESAMAASKIDETARG